MILCFSFRSVLQLSKPQTYCDGHCCCLILSFQQLLKPHHIVMPLFLLPRETQEEAQDQVSEVDLSDEAKVVTIGDKRVSKGKENLFQLYDKYPHGVAQFVKDLRSKLDFAFLDKSGKRLCLNDRGPRVALKKMLTCHNNKKAMKEKYLECHQRKKKLDQLSEHTEHTEQTSKPKQKGTEIEDILFDQRVQELKAYRDTNGHCRVPAQYGPNQALGQWVNIVRNQYACHWQGRKTSLTDARVYELYSLGFVWKPGTKKKEGLVGDEVWKKRVQELRAYRDTNGHCRVPFLYEPNKALGKWVDNLRAQYTRRGQVKTTIFTDARISELASLGFVWKVSSDELWKTRVEELMEYRDTNGHCRVPAEYEPNKALGWWVNHVRTQYKWRVQGKKTPLAEPLTDARISELDSLGFVWKSITTKEAVESDELLTKGSQNSSGLSASKEKPSNSIDQVSPPPVPIHGAPRNVHPQSSTAMLHTSNQISLNQPPASNAGLNAPPPVPLQESAPRNVLPHSTTTMLQTSNQIPLNPSPPSNAVFKDSKKFSFLDGMEEMFQAMRAEEKRREDEELRARHCRKPNQTVYD
jgi:hypothetical protein